MEEGRGGVVRGVNMSMIKEVLVASFTGLRVDVLVHGLLLVCVLGDWIIQYVEESDVSIILYTLYTPFIHPLLTYMHLRTPAIHVHTPYIHLTHL